MQSRFTQKTFEFDKPKPWEASKIILSQPEVLRIPLFFPIVLAIISDYVLALLEQTKIEMKRRRAAEVEKEGLSHFNKTVKSTIFGKSANPQHINKNAIDEQIKKDDENNQVSVSAKEMTESDFGKAISIRR